MSAPNTTIEILNVPLSSRQAHTFRFQNMQEQNAFFSERVVARFSEHTFVRRNAIIKLHVEDKSFPLEWRYLRVLQEVTGYSRWEYYFIEKAEYVNDVTYAFHLKLDVIQTHMFHMDLGECFIERQHAADGEAIGDNTVDEGLELGELINAHEYDVEGLQDMAVVIQSSVAIETNPDGTPAVAPAERFDNMFSGLGVYAYDLEEWQALSGMLQRYSENGAIDGIVNMYMYPKNLLVLDGNQTWEGMDAKTVYESGFDFAPLASYTNYKSKLFGGYTPKNKKLYTYPFNFLYLTNNQGGSAEYRYERFDDVDPEVDLSFAVVGGLSHDAGVFIYPTGYNGGGYEYGLQLGNFPACAWNSDTYKVWLAQNYNSLQVQGGEAVIKAAAGTAMMAAAAIPGVGVGIAAAGAGMAFSGYNQIAGLVAQKRDMQVQPAQARGAHSATVNANAYKQTFTFYFKTLSREYAERIDKYFTMYGYQQNKVARPNIHAHRALTFVKTQGCIVRGQMCTEDAAEIEAIFDNGVTFWSIYEVLDGDGQHAMYSHRLGTYEYDPV